MFSLLYGLWQQFFRKAEFYVLMIGLDRAGKTTMLEFLKAKYQGIEPLPPQKICPTVGLNIGKFDVSRAKVILWDLGGQSSLRSIWDKYYNEADGVVFVVDSGDGTRFQEAKRVFESVLQHPDIDGIPVLIMANKQDLPEKMSIADISTGLGLPSITTHPCYVQGVCALSGSGVEDGLEWLLEHLHQQRNANTR